MREFIQNLALPLFGYTGKLMVKSTSHFLDVAYSYVEMGWVDKEIEDNEVPKQPQQLPKQPQQHLNRCATRLKAAGITILSMKNDDDINFKLTTQFDKNKWILQIPRLTITQTTEVKWRSFIAWEHHKKKLKNGSSSVADRRSICTSSALLFRDLICCSSDVQLLKDRRVIVDQSNKSNRDLVDFFHSVASGVDGGIIDHKHITMFHALSAFPTKNYATKFFILLSHYFSKLLDWCYGIYNFLKRGYNFAAAILSLLTVIQTCYAVLAYHFPKR
ncbi:unnamed protein product [Trifolium pratense]|uniref:Uncharacterized protein n=1 Tax=Trifolium pratense TaxID=57577 RepID=A0ACB0J7C5_TRIPR|nr:unnamed protein product [Trifolium pratense]